MILRKFTELTTLLENKKPKAKSLPSSSSSVLDPNSICEKRRHTKVSFGGADMEMFEHKSIGSSKKSEFSMKPASFDDTSSWIDYVLF